MLPAGVPHDRIEALRKAFMAAITDPALLAEAEKMKLDLEAMSGDRSADLIASHYAMPPSIVERAKQAMIYKPPAR